jgi:hypothetical protein
MATKDAIEVKAKKDYKIMNLGPQINFSPSKLTAASTE